MTPFQSLLAVAAACLVLAGCAGGEEAEISPQQREALTDEMLEPNDLSGGYMAGMGIGNF
jgi:hypothetical protein